MLDPCLPFSNSVRGIFPGPATTQKVLSRYWMVFPAGRATVQIIDSFEHVDKGDNNNINPLKTIWFCDNMHFP